MIDVQQLEELKKHFSDLSETIKSVSEDSKSFEDNLLESGSGLSDVLSSVFSEDQIQKTIETVKKAITDTYAVDAALQQMNNNLGSWGDVQGVLKEIKDKMGETSPEEDKKKEKGKKGPSRLGLFFKKEMSGVTGHVKGAANKLKIPLPGGFLGGLIGIMTYGFRDMDRVRAEAGEVTNILVTATDGTLKNIVSKGKFYGSSLQETLQKYYGIARKDVQGVLKELVGGGIKVEDAIESVGGKVAGVRRTVTTTLLEVDKFLEVPGGTSAKKAVEYMRNYGMSLDEAVLSVKNIVTAGQESGIGIGNFMKNVEGAAGTLSKLGFNINDVVEIASTMQGVFEDMGIPKQFAGRQVSMGLSQIASSVSGMSDAMTELVAKKMGFGEGLDAVIKFKESWNRVLRDNNREELFKMVSAMTDVVLEASEDDINEAKYMLSKSLGVGIEGANLMLEMKKLIDDGRFDKAAKMFTENKDLFKDALQVEREKVSQFQLEFNKWLKGMAYIGRGILGSLLDSVAMLIAYFKSIPDVVSNYITGDDDANRRLKGRISDLFQDRNTEFLSKGVDLLKDGAEGMGMAVLGESLKNLKKAWKFDSSEEGFNWGKRGPKDTGVGEFMSGGRVKTVYVPITDTKGDTKYEAQTPAHRRRPTNTEAMYNSEFGVSQIPEEDNIEYVSEYVDDEGNIVLGARFIMEEEMNSKTSIVNKGFLGGRFRYQSLRPGAKEGRAHGGIDINAPKGTPIRSPESGHVIYMGKDERGSGNNIQIQHPGGETSWLMHLNKIPENFKVGSKINKGQYIGDVGATTGGKGKTSPHIHYEVLKPGVSKMGDVRRPNSGKQENFHLRMDPLKFFKSVGAQPFTENTRKKGK